MDSIEQFLSQFHDPEFRAQYSDDYLRELRKLPFGLIKLPRRVVHVSHEPYDVYIGRSFRERFGKQRYFPQSKWFNPFKVVPGVTHDDVVEQYERHIRNRPDLLASLPELQCKVLGCWCKAPFKRETRCHGEILIMLLQEYGYE